MGMARLALVFVVLSMGPVAESRDPSFAPHVVATMKATGSDQWCYMHLLDHYLYLGRTSVSGHTIETYNASGVWDGTTPTLLAKIAAPYSDFPTRGVRLGAMLHSVDSRNVSFDVSDRAAAKPVNLSSPTFGLVPGGGYEALCFWQGGDEKTYGVRMEYVWKDGGWTAVVFDTSRPAESVGNVSLGAAFTFAGSAYCVRGHVFYAIYTIDVRSPTSPVVVHTLPDRPALSDIAVDADRGLLFVPGYTYPDTYLSLYNVTNPSSPVLITKYVLPRGPGRLQTVQYGDTLYHLEVDGTMVYFVDPFEGVYMIDATAAEQPSLVSKLDHAEVRTYGAGFLLQRVGSTVFGVVQGGPTISFCALHQY